MTKEQLQEAGLDLPFWGRIVVFIVNLLPIPMWIKMVLPAIIAIIEKLPRDQRKAARDELVAAAKQASDGDSSALVPVLKKHCSGVGCPPDLVGDRARESD